jgi:hypothetical protein
MKETYYFSHDYNASQDPKILNMMAELGIEGYGLFWLLIEKLAEANGKLLLNDIKGLAFAWKIDCSKIDLLVSKFDLLHTDGTHFWSERLIENLKHRNNLSKTRAKIGRIGGLAKAKHLPSKSQANLKQNVAKERKGKERKGKDIINTKTETAIAVLDPKTNNNDVTFVYDIFKKHYGVSPKPIKAIGSNFDLNVAAAKRLVKVHGRETLETMLKFTLKYQNTDRYCRISTSPLDFEKNYSWYKTYFEQKKIELNKRRVEKLT